MYIADDIHDTTRDKVDRRHHKSGQSPSHPSSLNVPESGGSAPPTLYSQLPVGYVSRSVDSDSAHEGSTSSIRKNSKDIAPDVNVVDNPVTTRLPPPPQSISGHSVRSYAEVSLQMLYCDDLISFRIFSNAVRCPRFKHIYG